MLIELLFYIITIVSGSEFENQTDKELGGGPVVEEIKVEKKDTKNEDIFTHEVVLEEFKKTPVQKEQCEPEPAIVYSKIGIVIEAESGKVLYGKNEKQKVAIASLTKIMTAIVINDEIKDWDEKIRISKNAAFVGGAGVSLKWDEVIRAKELYKAMIMNSDNAAATAFAEHVGGSVEGFAELMNAKAKELGAHDTKFTEPSGLEDEISYSTAYDIALISQYALQQENITDIMKVPGPIQITSTDGLHVHRVGNTNKYLRDEKYLSLASRVTGGKTGFTYNAEYCLMMGLKDRSGERELIGVILGGDKNARWSEMEEILGWSFNNYDW